MKEVKEKAVDIGVRLWYERRNDWKVDWLMFAGTLWEIMGIWGMGGEDQSPLRGRSGFLEIVFVGLCEVLVCL